jgi:transcription elongation factor Elf1
MTISREDFTRFLEAKTKPEYQCTFCNNQTFGINSGRIIPDIDTPPVEMTIPFIDPRPVAPPGTHNFYSFACLNCGQSVFFHINQINEWLSKNPKPST